MSFLRQGFYRGLGPRLHGDDGKRGLLRLPLLRRGFHRGLGSRPCVGRGGRGCGASLEGEGFSSTRGVMPIYDGFNVIQRISLPGDPRVPA